MPPPGPATLSSLGRAEGTLPKHPKVLLHHRQMLVSCWDISCSMHELMKLRCHTKPVLLRHCIAVHCQLPGDASWV